MRVLFTPLPGGTHLHHQVTLAWAFRAAGHDVRVATLPALTPATLRSGLPAVEVGAGYDFMASVLALRRRNRFSVDELEAMPPEERDRRRDERFVPLVDLAVRTAAGLLRFAGRWRPHLIVTDPVVFAAPLVAAVLGVPVVRTVQGPDITYGHPLQGQPWTGSERAEWPTGLVQLFDRYRVEVRNDYPHHTIDSWPASLLRFGSPRRLPCRYVPYNGSGAAPGWLAERLPRPRVCVTWGTTTCLLGGDESLLPRVLRALAPLDIELVAAVSTADRRRLGPLPPTVRVAENLPLNLLLPSCRAIVNEGGTGSLLTAAGAGVPQVLIPEAAETPVNAYGFNAGGSAVVLDDTGADAATIASAVTTVLTDGAIRAAAAGIRDEIAAMPSPAEVAETLAGLVRVGA